MTSKYTQPRYEKMLVSLRYFLLGADMHRAVRALEFGLKHQVGTRKDGKTPEFYHPVEATQFIRTLLPSIMHPEDTIIAMLLHDIAEDYDIKHDELTQLFGERAATSICLLDKTGMTDVGYYDRLSTDPIASICKGPDRISNLGSMTDAFTQPKQVQYIHETRTKVLPMIKISRKIFTRQELAYENIKYMLNHQCDMIEQIHHSPSNNVSEHHEKVTQEKQAAT